MCPDNSDISCPNREKKISICILISIYLDFFVSVRMVRTRRGVAETRTTSTTTANNDSNEGMSITSMLASGSQRTRTNALGALDTFLANKQTSRAAVERAIAADSTGGALVVLFNKFAMHLAFGSGRSCRRVVANTSLSYFGQVYLLDMNEVRCCARSRTTSSKRSSTNSKATASNETARL